VQALAHAAIAGSQLDCIEKINEYNKRIEVLVNQLRQVRDNLDLILEISNSV